MPRRIPDYPDAFYEWNAIASFGSVISTLSAILFFVVLGQLLLTNYEKKMFVPNDVWNIINQNVQVPVVIAGSKRTGYTTSIVLKVYDQKTSTTSYKTTQH
jgi:heme/copper-type cytochrome/quinol oxidase subunit 1